MNLKALRMLAITSIFAASLTACIPDQSCSNPPHVRRASTIRATEDGATRQNPIEVGDVGSYGDWDLRVLDFSQTSDLVHVRIDAAFTGSDDETAGDLDTLKFCLAGSMHRLYLNGTDTYSADGPSPVFGSTEDDVQVRDGWLTFGDLTDDDDDFVLAVREAASILSRDADFMYFQLERDVEIQSDRSNVRRPTEAGTDIESPVPLGEAAVTSAFQISIAESYVGSEAAEMLSETSFFNPAPRDGKTFFLFKVDVTNTASGNSPASISSTQFSTDGFIEAVSTLIAGSIGSEAGGSELAQGAAANPFLELPGDTLEVTLYQGGSTEGWVLLEVDADTPPLVIYDPRLGTGIDPDKDRRYFLLTAEPPEEGDGEGSSPTTPTPSATQSAQT